MNRPEAAPRNEVVDRLSGALVDQADALAEMLLGLLRERPAVRPRHHMPIDALRERLPVVIADAGRAVADPDVWTEPEVLERLRAIAALRFEAGIDVQELHAELESLGQALFTAAVELVGQWGEAVGPAASASALSLLHQSLARLATILSGMLRELESERQRELSRRMRSFGRTVAHELKNPIGAARGAAQLLSEEGVVESAEQRDHLLGLILRNVDRATGLIDNVRTLSRLETPENETPERASLSAVVEAVRADLEPEAKERGVTVQIVEPLPDIDVDRSRVELALLNLLGNAIKYADADREESLATVRVSYRSDEEAWRIEVEDNGLGIPEAAKTKIFERFHRAHGDRDRVGAGLGLAIAREAVEQMHGTIDFTSESGEGSRFWFTIPESWPAQAHAAGDVAQ